VPVGAAAGAHDPCPSAVMTPFGSPRPLTWRSVSSDLGRQIGEGARSWSPWLAATGCSPGSIQKRTGRGSQRGGRCRGPYRQSVADTWEYVCEIIDNAEAATCLPHLLNWRGSEGWELVSLAPRVKPVLGGTQGGDMVAAFKRPGTGALDPNTAQLSAY
jgi:hypothetical protein